MNETITIVGTVGTDPEKRIRNGVPITSFRVGSKERKFDRTTGKWVDGDTNWYSVSAYRQLAEHAFESLHRRDRVIVTGRLHVRKWDNGEKSGTAVDIDADAIGHDLLFGTTAYVSGTPDSASSQSSAPDSWALTAAEEEVWANPGVENDANDPRELSGSPEGQSPDATGDAPVRALALAGLETPF